MKKNIFKIFMVLALSCSLVACSSDDDGSNEPITGNYFPNTVLDTWIYSVDNTSTTDSDLDFTATDLVTVETSSNGVFTLAANNGSSPARGAANSILTAANSTLNKGASTLSFTGELVLSEGLELLNNSIALTNMTLYDLNATTNSELASIENTITEDLDIEGTLIPTTIDYSIKNIKKSNLNSLTVDGETYSNVLHSKITMNVGVTITVSVLGNPTQYELLVPQDISVMDIYFAKDIGIVKAETLQSYQINESVVTLLQQAGFDLGMPTEYEATNTQELDSYVITE